jgi:hypothetical protein
MRTLMAVFRVSAKIEVRGPFSRPPPSVGVSATKGPASVENGRLGAVRKDVQGGAFWHSRL